MTIGVRRSYDYKGEACREKGSERRRVGELETILEGCIIILYLSEVVSLESFVHVYEDCIYVLTLLNAALHIYIYMYRVIRPYLLRTVSYSLVMIK